MKHLCISLIRDDLTNLRLLYGLADLNIGADHYMLHLRETVFGLMGFADNDPRIDAIYVKYDVLARNVMRIPIPEGKQEVGELAAEMYERLAQWKKELE
jgi:hypothetical protein